MLQINSENWQNRTAASLLHTIHLKMQHTEHTQHIEQKQTYKTVQSQE